MLDDLKYIHMRDSQDLFGVAARRWSATIPAEWAAAEPVSGVALTGDDPLPPVQLLGKRAVPALVPGRGIPPWLRSDSVVVVAATGYDDERVNYWFRAWAARPATERPRMIVVRWPGVAAAARPSNLPVYDMPVAAAESQRHHLVAFVYAVAGRSRLAALSDWQAAVGQTAEACRQWYPEVPADRNRAKRLARELLGQSVVMAADSSCQTAAGSWKRALNLYAKQVAWLAAPNFRQDELVGWTGQPQRKPYAVVRLQCSRTAARPAAEDRALSGFRPVPLQIESQGTNQLARTMYAASLGDYVALYLAMLNNVDPARQPIIKL